MATSLTVPRLDTAPRSSTTEHPASAFLTPTFDPADYLNTALPSLSTARPSSTATQNANRNTAPVSLNELSSQLQTLLSQLNAQTTRFSNTLTQLTDEIVRSGGRLAYEVEVLRGEVTGLGDALEGGRLGRDIAVFTSAGRAVAGVEDEDGKIIEEKSNGDGDADAGVSQHQQPEYLDRLRTLSSVRSRLDQVIKTFGDAMAWPLAPSELSMASSIISVSAPGNEDENRHREQKGKEYVEGVRREIGDLLSAGDVKAAEERVEAMRGLADVWKGTAEEKARGRIVEGLGKMVEEKRLQKEGKAAGGGGGQGGSRRPTPSPSRAAGDLRYGDREGGYGFLSNLKKLGGDVYLE